MSTIRNAKYMAQVVDFAGMKYGKCSPTDIDLTIDWQGKYFIFVELKYGGTQLTTGQKIYLRNVVNAINAGGKQAIAILASHKAKPEESIIAADANVIMTYNGDGPWTLKEYPVGLHDYIGELYEGYIEAKESSS